MSFTKFNFHQKITAGINSCGYKAPTPIQRQAIGPVLSGRDIMGLAQTGTGKTAAFSLPMLQRLIDGPRHRPRALVIAPTRELAEQINANIKDLGRLTGLRSISVYGGVSKAGQIKAFRSGIEIIVACPGRLLDHLDAGAVDLSAVEVLVLDEADMMFDMGFLPAIRRIIKRLPKKRQNLLFSATMPREIRGLAEEILNQPEVIQIDHSRPADTVSHVLYPVEKKQKARLLKTLINEEKITSALIFTRTKYGAKKLAARLAKEGHNATSIQGNLSQNKRRQALDGFRSGRFNILVATDIAARGIDVSGISHVINFDVPATVDAYTHRIGRTGRAECRGAAMTFASREDMDMVRQIEKTLSGRMEHKKHAAATPLAGEEITAEGNDRPGKRIFRRKKNAAPGGERKKTAAPRSAGTPGPGKNKPRQRRRSAPLGVGSFTNRDHFRNGGKTRSA